MTSVQAAPISHLSRMVPANQVNLNGIPSVASERKGPPSGPVSATLNFYKNPEDGSAPFNYVEEPPKGVPQRNFGDEDVEVNLQDVRGHEKEFHLDKHAFATLQGISSSPKIDWHDDESVKSVYYPEVEKLLLENVPGSPNRIILFDHTIRRALPNAHRAPVTRAHIDQTAKSAAQRVNFHSPEDAEKLLKGRYRIINVWRPLNGAVETHPLAFAEANSVPDTDMVGVEHKYPDRSGETAAIRYNPNHKWHYWSGIDNDERIFLQCFDSNSPSTRVPHSAFVDPRTTPDSKHRESIEVRALVFG